MRDLLNAVLEIKKPVNAKPFVGGDVVIYEGDPRCSHQMKAGDYNQHLQAKYGKAFECDDAKWYAIWRSVEYCDCGRKVIVQETGLV